MFAFWLNNCYGNRMLYSPHPWVAVFTPTDNLKSVRHCCIIERFMRHFLCRGFAKFYALPVGVGVFFYTGYSRIPSNFCFTDSTLIHRSCLIITKCVQDVACEYCVLNTLGSLVSTWRFSDPSFYKLKTKWFFFKYGQQYTKMAYNSIWPKCIKTRVKKDASWQG